MHELKEIIPFDISFCHTIHEFDFCGVLISLWHNFVCVASLLSKCSGREGKLPQKIKVADKKKASLCNSLVKLKTSAQHYTFIQMYSVLAYTSIFTFSYFIDLMYCCCFEGKYPIVFSSKLFGWTTWPIVSKLKKEKVSQ